MSYLQRQRDRTLTDYLGLLYDAYALKFQLVIILLSSKQLKYDGYFLQNDWAAARTDADIATYSLTNFTLSYLLANDKINRTYQMHKVCVINMGLAKI